MERKLLEFRQACLPLPCAPEPEATRLICLSSRADLSGPHNADLHFCIAVPRSSTSIAFTPREEINLASSSNLWTYRVNEDCPRRRRCLPPSEIATRIKMAEIIRYAHAVIQRYF